MEFLKLAEKRFSVRKYSPVPVEDEKLGIILEAGRLAPTAANIQPVKVVAIRKKEALEKLGKAADIYGAPSLSLCLPTAQKRGHAPLTKCRQRISMLQSLPTI